VKKYFDQVRKYSDRPWYLPFICLLAFVDLFVMVIPTEGLIVTTSILRPKRWLVTATVVTLASSLGALTLGALGYFHGVPFVAWVLGDDFFQSTNWIRMTGWIERWGFWGLWFISLGPLPQQPAILICALAHMPLFEIFGAVLLGRLPKYVLFSYLATHSPKYFRKFFGNEIEGMTLPPLDPKDEKESFLPPPEK
jgi:membrane protein YqaA with SNARE-associated domain